MTAKKPSTIGELRSSGYQVHSVKEEMRRNLIEKIRSNEKLFPGIIGFDDTVVPHLENAVLSGQDIIFLGERGQAKSRLIRALAPGWVATNATARSSPRPTSPSPTSSARWTP